MECFNYEFEFIIEDWISGLKPYQKELIQKLNQLENTDQAIEFYFSSVGPSNMTLFGGENENRKSYPERFKIEMQKLICGHPDYEMQQSEISIRLADSKTALITFIATIIGTKIQASEAYLVPCVVLFLSIVMKLGKNAYCAGIKWE